MPSVPPQRKARTTPGRKPRQPRLKLDEKAAVDKTARQLAAEVNEQLDEIRKEIPSRKYATSEERKRANWRRQKQRQRQQRQLGRDPELRCKGFRWDGKPCQLPPLIPENWVGPNEPTGLYCIHHEPNITREETDAFILHGDPTQPLPRRVTPGELAHYLVQRSPQAILEPYLKALGLKIDEETGDLIKTGRGLRIHGFSRGGEVVRSPYADLVGQVNVAEKLMDRVYGKPRQAVDLASSTTTVAVKIDMTLERVDKVTGVLIQAGVLPVPNGNGNGHRDVIEGTVMEDPLDE